MRLLYTFRYASYSGNCGGDLRLFFSTQNSADWRPSPPAPAPGQWIHPQNVGEKTTLASGDSLDFSLYPVTDGGMPGLLYLYGAIIVTTATGRTFGGPIGNAASVLFEPNKPVVAVLEGRDQNQDYGIQWDIGFELNVPWNGTSADCTGNWWAIWHSVPVKALHGS